jgi:hypothetical protein
MVETAALTAPVLLGQNPAGPGVSFPSYPLCWTSPHVNPVGLNTALNVSTLTHSVDGPQILQAFGIIVSTTVHGTSPIDVGLNDTDGWNDTDGMFDGTNDNDGSTDGNLDGDSDGPRLGTSILVDKIAYRRNHSDSQKSQQQQQQQQRRRRRREEGHVQKLS